MPHPSPAGSTTSPGDSGIVLFHHAQGLTDGVHALTATFRKAGHVVHVPDLYNGRTFPTLTAGLAYASRIGLDTFTERGVAAAIGLPANLTYIGISLGVMPAESLAQTRAGARSVVFISGCVEPNQYAPGWPRALPVQVHGMETDPIFTGEGDIDAARKLISEAVDGRLFLYHGNQHLFIDDSLPAYQPAAAKLATNRILTFLNHN